MTLTKAQISAIEELDWNVREYEDGYELETWSNAGEDILVWIPKDEEPVSYLYRYWQDFDPDEHAAMWYGKNRGEPSSMRALLDDADYIDSMLKELFDTLRALEKAAAKKTSAKKSGSKCTKPYCNPKATAKKAPAKKAPSKNLKSSVGKRPARKAPAKKVTPRRK